MAGGMTPNTITPRAPMPHTHYMGLSGTALRLAIGATAGLTFIAFGYGQGDIGGLMIVKTFLKQFPQMTGVTLKAGLWDGIVIGIWNLGCFLGSLLTIFLGDRLGRKGSIIAGLVIMIIGKIIQVSSFGLGQYMGGRAMAGVGNGIIASTIPAWQAECLKTHRRGTLLMVSFGSCITAGLALAYWMSYALSFTEPSSASWRVPVALAMLPMLGALGLVVWLPESPRYLILTGREQEAKNVLSALNEFPPDDEDIHREFLMIKHTILHMTGSSIGEVFKQGNYRYLHRTLLAVGLQIMQQFTGVNLFMQYLGAMFQNQLKFQPKLSLLLASCCSTEFFIASLVAVVGIDRFWGRRTLTIFGAAGMCFCMIVLCIMAWMDTKPSHYTMAAFLFIYNSFFSIGWQGMSWLWAVELTPLTIRGPANALATAANWLSNFIVVFITPVLFINTAWRTYIVFAITNACIVPIIFFFYPETGYRSLEEVDVLFREASTAGHPWLSVVSTARKEPLWYDKNGDPSDSYASEQGRSNSESEKTLTKENSGTESDAVKWSQQCRGWEHSSHTSTTISSQGQLRASSEAALPPPNIAVHRASDAGLAK